MRESEERSRTGKEKGEKGREREVELVEEQERRKAEGWRPQVELVRWKGNGMWRFPHFSSHLEGSRE